MKLKYAYLVVGLVLLVLGLDQASKFWVKTQMVYGERIPIFGADWAYLHFVENDGMAFGKRFDFKHGKLILSLFRILAAGFLISFLRTMLRERVPLGLIVSFTLILAGAIGNILDSAFYGLIFSESFFHGPPAVLFPVEGGYDSFLHGKVVDMFYFPMYQTILPEWMPFWGNTSFTFFAPVFNVADVAISWGVLQILLFHRSYFQQHPKEESELFSISDNDLAQGDDHSMPPLSTTEEA